MRRVCPIDLSHQKWNLFDPYDRRSGLCVYDEAKKIKERKRHILVITQGFLLGAFVSRAGEKAYRKFLIF